MALYSKTGISKVKHFLNLNLKLFLETHKDMLCLHVKRMCSLWYFAMCKVAWEKIIKKASKENSVAWHHFFRTLSGLDTCCLTQCTEFFNQSSMTKCYSNIWDVSTMYVISWCSFFAVIVSNPMKFHLRKKKENMRFGMSMKLRLMLGNLSDAWASISWSVESVWENMDETQNYKCVIVLKEE